MGRRPRKWLAQQAGRHRRIVEVGVWKGRSTSILAKYTKGTVWAVDNWLGTPHDPAQHKLYPDAAAAHAEFRRNLRPHIKSGRVRVVRMNSFDAAWHLMKTEAVREPFDFVFIDADHSYEAVQMDISAWLPLIRTGGLLAGHDYKDTYPGVQRAVDEAFGARATIGPKSIWSVTVGGAKDRAA
jgi:predicted O-methyltransferase YrrM